LFSNSRESAPAQSPICTGDIHSGGDTLGGFGTIHKTTYIYQGMTHAHVPNQLGGAEKATRNFLRILDQLFGE
jgi:hypothetical protein